MEFTRKYEGEEFKVSVEDECSLLVMHQESQRYASVSPNREQESLGRFVIRADDGSATMWADTPEDAVDKAMGSVIGLLEAPRLQAICEELRNYVRDNADS